MEHAYPASGQHQCHELTLMHPIWEACAAFTFGGTPPCLEEYFAIENIFIVSRWQPDLQTTVVFKEISPAVIGVWIPTAKAGHCKSRSVHIAHTQICNCNAWLRFGSTVVCSTIVFYSLAPLVFVHEPYQKYASFREAAIGSRVILLTMISDLQILIGLAA